MAGELKLRRGTSAQVAAFTGAAGEVTPDTTNNRLVLHDGTTAGGHPVASEAYVDAAIAGIPGTGDVVGPASATDAAVAGYNGPTGKLIRELTATQVRTAAGATTTGASLLTAADAAAARSSINLEPLPTIALTFDYYKEGGQNAFSTIMSSRGLAATYYSVASLIGTAGMPTADELLLMSMGGWEIGWYTNENMVTAQTANRTTCFAKFKTAKSDFDTLGFKIKSIAPTGRAWNSSLAGMAKSTEYTGVRVCNTGASLQAYPIDDPWFVNDSATASWDSTTTYAGIVAEIDACIAAKALWVPVIHKVGAVPDGYTVDTTIFTQIMDYIVTKRDAGLVRVVTFSEAMKLRYA